MSLKVSNKELKERFHNIKEKCEVQEQDLNLMKDIIDSDIFGLSVVLYDEGMARKLKKILHDITIEFLKEYSNGDYEIFSEYYKKSLDEWDFLNKDQLRIIKNINNMYKESLQKYFEDRGDLMIFRKTVNNFIASRLKNKESMDDLHETRNYLLNNYSYQDSLYNLGLNPQIDSEGMVKLTPLSIDENGKLYQKAL